MSSIADRPRRGPGGYPLHGAGSHHRAGVTAFKARMRAEREAEARRRDAALTAHIEPWQITHLSALPATCPWCGSRAAWTLDADPYDSRQLVSCLYCGHTAGILRGAGR